MEQQKYYNFGFNLTYRVQAHPRKGQPVLDRSIHYDTPIALPQISHYQHVRSPQPSRVLAYSSQPVFPSCDEHEICSSLYHSRDMPFFAVIDGMTEITLVNPLARVDQKQSRPCKGQHQQASRRHEKVKGGVDQIHFLSNLSVVDSKFSKGYISLHFYQVM
ncbi:S-adenosyl-L-methionine-dependentmethyltransferases superfamily protein [Striga asiatica]|uniref:S-adenosyl-L-methionine-dependentmethyltransferases superfamily protein n=1 Tax=Striga asiatica TaxID=4170 RepID=A0A5A7PZ62_STRAF|nr:S-adenosyl-L-methionine-dependentmethyltransferases superfamily protein [Striga asiatica]